MKTDVLVIGAGAAGMAAAISAARNNVRVVLVDRDERTGGVLNQCIHSGFGLHYLKEELTGPEYAERFSSLLKEYEIDVVTECCVHTIKPNGEAILISPSGVHEIVSKAIICATGAREKPFGSLMIPGDRPSGIFTAGVAQRYLNIENRLIGKRALILGSGDIGMIMARRLTLEGVEVACVVERLPYPSGLLRNVIQCLEDFNIPLYLSSTVVEVRGKERLEEVVVAKVDSEHKPILGTERTFKVDTLILSVGLIPETKLLENVVKRDPSSEGILCSSVAESSAEPIFAAGNCTVIYDFADYVTIEGEKAGKYAALYAKGERFDRGIPITRGENIGILFPQRWAKDDDLILYIRSARPMRKAKLIVNSFENTFEDMTPSEMMRVKVPYRYLANCQELIVSLREE